MSDEHWMFKRQMEWQKQRARLSWPEKIRLAESMREAALLFRDLQREQPRRTPVERQGHATAFEQTP